jgi:hypothetical protein
MLPLCRRWQRMCLLVVQSSPADVALPAVPGGAYTLFVTGCLAPAQSHLGRACFSLTTFGRVVSVVVLDTCKAGH